MLRYTAKAVNYMNVIAHLLGDYMVIPDGRRYPNLQTVIAKQEFLQRNRYTVVTAGKGGERK